MKGEGRERGREERKKDDFSEPVFSVPLLVRYRASDKLPDVYIPTVSSYLPLPSPQLAEKVTSGLHRQWRYVIQGRSREVLGQNLKLTWAWE